MPRSTLVRCDCTQCCGQLQTKLVVAKHSETTYRSLLRTGRSRKKPKNGPPDYGKVRSVICDIYCHCLCGVGKANAERDSLDSDMAVEAHVQDSMEAVSELDEEAEDNQEAQEDLEEDILQPQEEGKSRQCNIVAPGPASIQGRIWTQGVLTKAAVLELLAEQGQFHQASREMMAGMLDIINLLILDGGSQETLPEWSTVTKMLDRKTASVESQYILCPKGCRDGLIEMKRGEPRPTVCVQCREPLDLDRQSLSQYVLRHFSVTQQLRTIFQHPGQQHPSTRRQCHLFCDYVTMSVITSLCCDYVTML